MESQKSIMEDYTYVFVDDFEPLENDMSVDKNSTPSRASNDQVNKITMSLTTKKGEWMECIDEKIELKWLDFFQRPLKAQKPSDEEKKQDNSNMNSDINTDINTNINGDPLPSYVLSPGDVIQVPPGAFFMELKIKNQGNLVPKQMMDKRREQWNRPIAYDGLLEPRRANRDETVINFFRPSSSLPHN